MHEIHLGQALMYMQNVIPPDRSSTINRTLRNACDNSRIFARTEKFKNSLYARTIEEYN